MEGEGQGPPVGGGRCQGRAGRRTPAPGEGRGVCGEVEGARRQARTPVAPAATSTTPDGVLERDPAPRRGPRPRVWPATPARPRTSCSPTCGAIGLGEFSRTSYYLTMADDARSRWQDRYDRSRVREADFTTLSGMEVQPAYGTDASEWPGEFPFTRGLYPTGYRGRTWTIRQFAGFGNAQQTNERYRMILGRGGGGLSVAFDMPTLMGRDSDDPKALGEVGPLRGRDRLGRRHGDALRRHRPRCGHHLDDDQRPGRAGLLHDDRRGRARRASTRARSTAPCRPTSSRSTSRRRSGCSPPSPTCA